VDRHWVGRGGLVLAGCVSTVATRRRGVCTPTFRGLKPPGYNQLAATRLKNRPGISRCVSGGACQPSLRDAGVCTPTFRGLKPSGYTRFAATRLKIGLASHDLIPAGGVSTVATRRRCLHSNFPGVETARLQSGRRYAAEKSSGHPGVETARLHSGRRYAAEKQPRNPTIIIQL